ncbi:MAG: DM13 domain-containing protein [Acidiferrobacterales bacterium]
MKKVIIWFVVGGVLGGVAGFAAGIFVYPYIFLADIVAMETVQNVESRTVVGRGEFIHANPSDPIHYGGGKVTVYDDVVHLNEDFVVGPGPAFHVYLVPEKNVTPNTKIAQTMFVDLGRLRAFKGSQVYSIPVGVDLKNYGSVVIWCKEFGVLISPAMLSFL